MHARATMLYYCSWVKFSFMAAFDASNVGGVLPQVVLERVSIRLI